jgi:hypothetical protein
MVELERRHVGLMETSGEGSRDCPLSISMSLSDEHGEVSPARA